MEAVDPLRIIISFTFVLGLIGLCAMGARAIMRRNPGWLAQKPGARLQIVESKMLDARRKLVLIKRDEQEHLLLLSPQGEIVIESIKGENK